MYVSVFVGLVEDWRATYELAKLNQHEKQQKDEQQRIKNQQQKNIPV